MDAADIPPEIRAALRGQLFNEWIHAVPSVMERLGITTELLEEREKRADELAEQMRRLAPTQSTDQEMP